MRRATAPPPPGGGVRIPWKLREMEEKSGTSSAPQGVYRTVAGRRRVSMLFWGSRQGDVGRDRCSLPLNGQEVGGRMR